MAISIHYRVDPGTGDRMDEAAVRFAARHNISLDNDDLGPMYDLELVIRREPDTRLRSLWERCKARVVGAHSIDIHHPIMIHVDNGVEFLASGGW